MSKWGGVTPRSKQRLNPLLFPNVAIGRRAGEMKNENSQKEKPARKIDYIFVMLFQNLFAGPL